MLDVYLFRHGETYCNNDGRHTGWLPYGLNDTGREQAVKSYGTFSPKAGK